MANCLQTYEEFVKNTFSPQIAIISGADCDSICSKNNLTLVDLLQPFSRLNAEISVRDPAGYAYTVSNLKLGFKDIVTPPPSQHVAPLILLTARWELKYSGFPLNTTWPWVSLNIF